MLKKRKKIIAVAIVVIFIALILLLPIILDKLNQERCYNLPLNTFYEDESCLKYTEVLDD